MISIIITAYKEEKTIAKAIEQFLKNKISDKSEILVLAPDEQTLEIAKKLKVKTIKDPGKGKPAALNLAFQKAKGDILILTDGDVFIDENALSSLLAPFQDKNIGAVSGHPISLNPKDNLLGYWSHTLTRIAHLRRLKAIQIKKRFTALAIIMQSAQK